MEQSGSFDFLIQRGQQRMSSAVAMAIQYALFSLHERK